MTSEQYEEICRRFIAEEEKLPIDHVRSVRVPNPTRPGLPEYAHQIDLYWETGSSIATYLNIANVKWRGIAKVEQGEILLLQQVRTKVAAHKAFVITNLGFTAGAIAAAKDEGIALHVLEPESALAALSIGDREAIQAQLAQIAGHGRGPIWTHRVEHRGLGFDASSGPGVSEPATGTTSNQGSQEQRIVQPVQQPSAPAATRATGAIESRGGPARSNRGRGHGGSRTR
jgi:hypothetical protein